MVEQLVKGAEMIKYVSNEPIMSKYTIKEPMPQFGKDVARVVNVPDEVVKKIRADAIDDFANWLVEQGILGNRCISDGEITDYGKVYAKKYKEQLKAGGLTLSASGTTLSITDGTNTWTLEANS